MSSAEYEAIDLHPDRNSAMRSANSEHRKLLLPRSTEPRDRNGREQYLSARSQVTPRDKYYYPEATSWRYGWVRNAEEATSK